MFNEARKGQKFVGKSFVIELISALHCENNISDFEAESKLP